MNLWKWLLGSPSPKIQSDRAIPPRPNLTHAAKKDEWAYVSRLPSEKATCDVTYRACQFAISRDRVVRGFKLREVSESEYLASWVEHLGRPLRGFEKKRKQEHWRKNLGGRIFAHQLIISDACKLIDPSGLLARIWIDSSCGHMGNAGEQATSERASGKWGMWGGFDPPDDHVPSRNVSTPPLLMETPFSLANEPALSPDLKANRILDCLPLIRSDRLHHYGGTGLEGTIEAVRSLVLGGIKPAALQHVYKSEMVTPYRIDHIVVTPYMIRFGPSIEQYARDGSYEYGGIEIKKALDGMWWICEHVPPEPR